MHNNKIFMCEGVYTCMSIKDSFKFDFYIALMSFIVIIGFTLDFREHRLGKSFEEEGYITLFHSLAFLSFFAILLGVFFVVLYNRFSCNDKWIKTIPKNYGTSIIGIFLFCLSSLTDFIWHIIFGFESGVEAITSPSHILMGIGFVLLIISPLRKIWLKRNLEKKEIYLGVFSFSLIITTIILFTLYSNPIMNLVPTFRASSYASIDLFNLRGITNILIFNIILMASIIMLLRRFTLPIGSITIILTTVSLISVFFSHNFVFLPAFVISGVLADIFYYYTQPSIDNIIQLRIFSILLPFVTYSLYYLTIWFEYTINLNIHVWTGSIVTAMISSLLVSYAIIPTKNIQN